MAASSFFITLWEFEPSLFIDWCGEFARGWAQPSQRHLNRELFKRRSCQGESLGGWFVTGREERGLILSFKSTSGSLSVVERVREAHSTRGSAYLQVVNLWYEMSCICGWINKKEGISKQIATSRWQQTTLQNKSSAFFYTLKVENMLWPKVSAWSMTSFICWTFLG